MAEYPFNWPGVPGGPIIFSFPVTAMIVPTWRTQQRPGIKARSPRRSIQHTNGNSNALARQDSTYLFNGAGGRTASWHGTVDHIEGIANLPGDEVGWQAGDGAGPGNMSGFAVELSEWTWKHGTAAQWREARRRAAEMIARVSARIGANDPDYHADFMNKNCPRPIRGNTTWMREYESDWWFYLNDEKKRMAGGSPVVSPYKVGDRIEVTAQALNVRVGYGLDYRVVTTLKPGRTATVIKDTAGTSSVHRDGYTWLNVNIDDFGTGWMATGTASESWIGKASTPAPVEPPKQYAKAVPIPALLETSLNIGEKYDTAEAVTEVGESDFIFVADVIEFKRSSPAKQYALDGAKDVKAPYQEGDRAIAAWIVKSSEGTYWYLLAGADDEWVRVKQIDTVRIADAPLLGDDVH